MNTLDELRILKRDTAELNRLLMNIRRTGGGGNGGEANTASNQGVGGVGLFDAKVGVDLQFRNINAGSTKITVTLDGANKEVDIDIDETKIDHDNLLNFVINEHIDWTNAVANLLTTGTARIDGDIASGIAPGTYSLRIYRSGVNASIVAERSGGAQCYINATDSYGNFGTVNNYPLRLVVNGAWKVYIDSGGHVGIGTQSPSQYADLTLEGGALCTKEIATPTADTNYGKWYTKTDNKAYFQDGAGVEHEISFVGAAGVGAENFQAHRKTGRWYTQQYDNYGLTTSYCTIDFFYAFPFIVPVQQSFDRIGINCNAAVTNGVFRLGIYDDDGVYPGDLVVESGELDCSTTGNKEATISETLDPGLYWLVLLCDGDSSPSFRALRYQYFMQPVIGRTAQDDLIGLNGLRGSYTYGVLPSTFPGGITEVDGINQPAIMLRVA